MERATLLASNAAEVADLELTSQANAVDKVRPRQRVQVLLPLTAALAAALLGCAAWLQTSSTHAQARDAPAEALGVGVADGELVSAAAKKDKPAAAAEPAEKAPTCSTGNDNCNITLCCAEPGLQCYEQDGLYAKCRPSCNPGPDPTHWDEKSWSCQTLGNRSSGDLKKCSEQGEDCSKTQCCAQPGTQCFRKNANWASCKAECIPNAPDLSDQDGEPWSCERLGPFTPGAQGWVWQKCSQPGQACQDTKCCIEGNAQCYTQTGPVTAPYWAECRQYCAPGQKNNPWEQGWDCGEVGTRTPAGVPHGGLLAKWAQKKCADHGKDCRQSKCCLGMDAVCYEKNSKWATCKTSCSTDPDPYDGNATWTCKELGPKSPGLAKIGFPSLYCFSLTRTSGYELEIMKAQVTGGIGIYACDEADIYSADGVVVVGTTPDGEEVSTIQVEPAVIKTTVDGTAGNAKLFANVWDKVVETNRWRHHAFTVKMDPDAVVIPSRLRAHMYNHVGEKIYVLNCNKFPSSPNFPMMFGSVEIFSFGAMETFSTGKETCKENMGQWLESWGEDYYLGKCMDLISVGRIADFGVVGDSVCTGADCHNPGIAAFHAFKSLGDWMNCHSAAQSQETRK